jgi:hypothetical protein
MMKNRPYQPNAERCVHQKVTLENVFRPPAFFGEINASFQILDSPQADLRFETQYYRDLEPKSYF